MSSALKIVSMRIETELCCCGHGFRVAMFRGARFESLGQGIETGSVQSLLFTRSCL